jgi:molecular chaperone GrpE
MAEDRSTEPRRGKDAGAGTAGGAAKKGPANAPPLTPEQAAAVEAEAAPLEEALLEGAEASAERVEGDLEELAVRARERDEYLALAQRTQADFENFRKRSARDVATAEARGIAKLARDLLPALDNLHRAIEALGDDESVVGGIRLVEAELTAALARMGIEGFSPEGEPFDPNEHEAVAQQPTEGAQSGTVVEVYQRGYRVTGKGEPTVLRPARVVVAA